ncbi:MAG: hypothetical protein KJ587_18215 [Alphaproteobacteria bacterium]|nr:hypothetical protein [Alphaproteobacteria bacterium]
MLRLSTPALAAALTLCVHGGQFVETGDHHGVEMVLTGASLVFHMTEDHDPLEFTGSSFQAIIQTDAGTRMVELEAEGTTLSATLDAPLAKAPGSR